MNGKKIFRIRQIAAGVVFLLAVAGILGLFYGVKVFDIQLMPVVQKLIIDFSVLTLVLFLILAVLTFIFGRIYCSLICPFGILQEIVGFFKNKIHRPKNSKRVNFPLKYFIAAICWGALFGGTAVVIRYVDPYSVFGSTMSLTLSGLVVAVIVVFALILKDRIFCTDFCCV